VKKEGNLVFSLPRGRKGREKTSDGTIAPTPEPHLGCKTRCCRISRGERWKRGAKEKKRINERARMRQATITTVLKLFGTAATGLPPREKTERIDDGERK